MYSYDGNNNTTRRAFVFFIVFSLLLFIFLLFDPIGKYKNDFQPIKTVYKKNKIAKLPPLLPAPYLQQKSFEVKDAQALGKKIAWSNVGGSENYIIEIWTDKNLTERLSIQATENNFYTWQETYPGTYYFRITAIDKYRRNGRPSPIGEFNIIEVSEETPQFVKELTQAIATAEPEFAVQEVLNSIVQRRPASVPPELIEKRRMIAQEEERIQKEIEAKELKVDQTIIANADKILDSEAKSQLYYTPPPLSVLDPFYHSNVSLELGTFGIISTTYTGGIINEIPFSSHTTIKGIYQSDGPHVYEGQLRASTLALNSTAETISPISLEGRYHYRWIWPITGLDWSFLSRIQVSAFGGFELYRNKQSTSIDYFLSEYNFLKFGAKLRFSVFDQWETGGEIAYAFSPTNDINKIELQGYIDYLLRGTYIIGLGYRAHLLEANDSTKTPLGIVPYREAHGEAFGTIKYQF